MIYYSTSKIKIAHFYLIKCYCHCFIEAFLQNNTNWSLLFKVRLSLKCGFSLKSWSWLSMVITFHDEGIWLLSLLERSSWKLLMQSSFKDLSLCSDNLWLLFWALELDKDDVEHPGCLFVKKIYRHMGKNGRNCIRLQSFLYTISKGMIFIAILALCNKVKSLKM